MTAADPGLAVGGIDHAALTVIDLDISERFYTQVLGLMTLFDFGSGRLLLCRHTGFSLGLLRHDGGDGGRFDHRRTGLDHLGFGVESRAELERWEERLRALGVPYTPIRDMELGHHLNFRDPDGIALELSAPNELMREALGMLRSRTWTAGEVREIAARRFGSVGAYVVADH